MSTPIAQAKKKEKCPTGVARRGKKRKSAAVAALFPHKGGDYFLISGKSLFFFQD